MAKKLKKKKKQDFSNLKCPFGSNPSKINYKDVYTLKKFITTRGRILQSERTGVSHKCQRKLAQEIKRARYMALLPYNELL
ncbi:MAG TPA: 30S ribosomal protein S18 [Candidatus Dojkabacteria bacterium]|jgi:small subunit ribosomal protein S18